METGIGFSEIVVIILLMLLFFGTKELPQLLRKLAKVNATIQQYINTAKSEVQALVTISDESQPPASQSELRNRACSLYMSQLSSLGIDEYNRMSGQLIDQIIGHNRYCDASSVLVHLDITWKSCVDKLIKDMRRKGKKVIATLDATCKNGVEYLDITAIVDNCWVAKDMIRTAFDVHVVQKDTIELILSPAIAFDNKGTRLYKERGVFEYALHDLRGTVPFVGFGFTCQVSNDELPKDPRGIPVTEIITENGIVPVITSYSAN